MFPGHSLSLLPSPVPDPHPLAGEFSHLSNPKPTAFPTPLKGERHQLWLTLPCGWGIPVPPSHPQFLCIVVQVSFFRVWVDPVYCLCLSPAPRLEEDWQSLDTSLPQGPTVTLWGHL